MHSILEFPLLSFISLSLFTPTHTLIGLDPPIFSLFFSQAHFEFGGHLMPSCPPVDASMDAQLTSIKKREEDERARLFVYLGGSLLSLSFSVYFVLLVSFFFHFLRGGGGVEPAHHASESRPRCSKSRRRGFILRH